ncbi:hypothetical protein ABEG18_13000 [Alsobacter sp. KACC 23698]|uniref:Cyanophage baseplate Pam3 plug gp18 domain-containing protein n=1 Tax=Alsobacter sp. KACC 23698 TaxID=3149229 RepID=A0AAU7JMM5_9HYPH
MGTFRELPIISAPSQRFTTVLMDRRCDFLVEYNGTTNRWSFSLDVDGVPALAGRRIVVGVDLLSPFVLGVGRLIAFDWEQGAEPGRDELPAGKVRLLHYDPEDDAA